MHQILIYIYKKNSYSVRKGLLNQQWARQATVAQSLLQVHRSAQTADTHWLLAPKEHDPSSQWPQGPVHVCMCVCHGPQTVHHYHQQSRAHTFDHIQSKFLYCSLMWCSGNKSHLQLALTWPELYVCSSLFMRVKTSRAIASLLETSHLSRGRVSHTVILLLCSGYINHYTLFIILITEAYWEAAYTLDRSPAYHGADIQRSAISNTHIHTHWQCRVIS